jgi:hypothetical protein
MRGRTGLCNYLIDRRAEMVIMVWSKRGREPLPHFEEYRHDKEEQRWRKIFRQAPDR